MNTRRCLKIATRMSELLEKEIGVGVDARRMLTEHLYLRDVLLVCEAHRGTELSELALWFRRSAAEVSAVVSPAVAAPSGFGLDSVFPGSGYDSSTFDSQRDMFGPMPSPAMLVRQELEQQRAAARRGGALASGQRVAPVAAAA